MRVPPNPDFPPHGRRWYGPPQAPVLAPDGGPGLKLGEKALLERIVGGGSIISAADDMKISRATANAWLRTARLRFGATNTVHLVKIVTERGLLEEES